MRRALIGILAVCAGAAPAAQRPDIQNARVETRGGASVAGEISAIGTQATPVWVAWSVPMVPGDRHLCSTWNDGTSSIRGEMLERENGARPAIAPPAGPVRLEGGTSLVILLRVLGGRPERIRSIGDDCPIDGGGAAIRWLTGVTPAESLQFLDGVTRTEALNIGSHRRLAEGAVQAIGLHEAMGSFAVLDRVVASSRDDALRRLAAAALAAHRGAQGFDRVRSLIADERNRDVRRSFVGALAQSPDTRAVPALLEIARGDAEPGVRGEAASRYVRRTGQSGLATAVGLIESSPSDEVKRRIVSAIASLPEPVATPTLIQLARTHANVAVRKEALSALGRFRDPQARAVVEDVLR